MSKPAANPFFEVDFSKFADFSKLAGEFKAPMNMEPLLAAQRRNIEAMTAVGQAAFESMQALARRQADAMRQGMEEAANMMSSMMTSPSPEEKVMRQAEASKAAMEKCIANARDIAETLSKCNTQAMEVVTNRLSESVEELRGMMKPRQQDAA
jgi:phasin family protein